MPLISEVRAILNTLKDRGWGDLLERHGLDITATDLTRPLTAIDRTIPGFEDFAEGGNQGIARGSPARSLLYHALASPYVHPTADGSPSGDPEDYPELDDLDVVENYIFSLAKKRISDFDNPVIAVFAYQYRVGSRSAHRVHADLAYSRTGVSRVGTHDNNYDRRRRSFWVLPKNGKGIAVCPARFGVFIAERRNGDFPGIAVLRGISDDRFQPFLLPVHKVFPGNECLEDEQIDPKNFKVLEYHINEKLRKTHLADTPGVIPLRSGFHPDVSPFVRKSDELVELEHAGASRLLVPKTPSNERLVRLGRQRNDDSGKDEIVRFRVPPGNPSNRFFTSFAIPGQRNGRAAPEYVNIRQKVTNPTGTVDDLDDLNKLDPDDFEQTLDKPNFEAAHFLDDSCDGAVVAQLKGQQGLVDQLDSFAAYSLVAAPDFLPLTDQVDIQDWAEETLTTPRGLKEHFNQGGPRALSDGRRIITSFVGGTPSRGRMPNPALVDPRASQNPAFDRNDPVNTTITAVVCPAPLSSPKPAKVRRNVSVSFLPDAASDIFAPGWDISQHGDASGEFYHAYGLGSPFPEDAKLCAMLNSFWPAAAPDTSRTFGFQGSPTALPMLDAELGYHPNHPRVLAGEVAPGTGWDGEHGPFLEEVGGDLFVNYADRDRSDYVRNALDGIVSIELTADVDSHEMIARMEALRDCIRVLPPKGDRVSKTPLWLVVAEKVDDWSGTNVPLTGPGYLYEFVEAGNDLPKDPNNLPRLRREVADQFVCQISTTQIRWNKNGGAFHPDDR